MAKNSNLTAAARAKKDEFYTQLEDIERELTHDDYRQFFRGKIIFCNCDDPYESEFFKFFAAHFNDFELKKLIVTCYAGSPISGVEIPLPGFEADYVKPRNEIAYKVEISELKDYDGDGAEGLDDIKYLLERHPEFIVPLKGNGDFRSPECIELLKEADVVVTNPPFSLFREFVALLMKYNKFFAIIGHMNAITYKEIFPLIKNDKMWLGYGFKNMVAFFGGPYQDFAVANDHRPGLIRNSGVTWYTNIPLKKFEEELTLTCHYTPEKYPKYDNYDAIEVSRTALIPCDYFADMGVPITYLDKHNPKQFEIVKFRKGNDGKDLTYTVEDDTISQGSGLRAQGSGLRAQGSGLRAQGSAENYAIFPDYHSAESVTASWECQSPSSTNTTQSNLKLSEMNTRSELQRGGRISTGGECTQESLSGGKCNGIMGVPITFLDKYNPNQFEIIGLDRYTVPKKFLVGGRLAIKGKPCYARILIKRK